MQLHLSLDIPSLQKPIKYTDAILLLGSCFTEHMSGRFAQHKFKILSNPNGILFNPLSVAESLNSYTRDSLYTEQDLFHYNELWNSWKHHTRFSHIDRSSALDGINKSQKEAGAFIRHADHLIITLGSAYQYYLRENGMPVSNNHRGPSQWFEKKLLDIDEIVNVLSDSITQLRNVNPDINVVFTISPVRHAREGVINNNRSKGRLIDAVHTLCAQLEQTYYFPAYELVIDILRDYRYYDIDFVHPNYLATSYVWEQFANACIEPGTQSMMKEIHEIVIAHGHKARFPETDAHQRFMAAYATKTEELMKAYPSIDLSDELRYFREGENSSR